MGWYKANFLGGAALAVLRVYEHVTEMTLPRLLPFLLTAVRAQDISTLIRSSTIIPLNASPCLRLLRADGDTGCAGESVRGDTGILLPVDGAASLAVFLGLGSAGGPADSSTTAGVAQSFVAVVSPEMLTASTLQSLSSLAWLAGVIVTDSSRGAGHLLSDLTRSPPGAHGYEWNLRGLAILREGSWPFAIALVRGAESSSVTQKASANAAALAKGNIWTPAAPWAARLRLYFGPPTLSSERCLADGSCSPLGGFSVWGVLNGTQGAAGRMRVPGVMAIAKLDAAGFFEGLAVGADGTVSSLIALLLAAEALGRLLPAAAELPLPILFGAFQGESWGRLGSRRWATEVVNPSSCSKLVNANASSNGRTFCASPIRADATYVTLNGQLPAHVIALDQIGGSPGAPPPILFAHNSTAAASSGPPNWASAVLAAVGDEGAPRVLFGNAGLPLPPSPLSSFLEAAPGLVDGTVLSGYNDSFANAAWSSRGDNATDVNGIIRAATLLTRALWALASNVTSSALDAAATVPAALTVNATLARELLNCFTVDMSSCAPAASLGRQLPVGPVSLYPSVYSPATLVNAATVAVSPSVTEDIVRALLALWAGGISLSGENIGSSSSAPSCSANSGATCRAPLDCVLGWCIEPSAYFHDAYSTAVAPTGALNVASLPAFSFNASIASALGADADPVFCEPLWANDIGVALLRIDHPGVGGGVLAAGITASLISLSALYFDLLPFNKREWKVD